MPPGVMDGQQAPASNVPTGYVVNEAKLIANPQGEGTYKMVGPKGQTVQVPFSKVRFAQDFHYQVVGDPSDSKTDAGRYRGDAAVLAPSFLHSVETSLGVSIPQLKAEELEREQHPVKNILEKGLGGPAYAIAKGLVQQVQHSYVSGRDAIKEYRGGNTDAAIVDAVEAVPILGHGINVAASQAPATTGSYWRDLGHVVTSGPTMGTVLVTAVQTAAALDGLFSGVAAATGVAGAELGASAADVGGTTAAMTEGAGADAAILPVDAAPSVDASAAAEGEGATTAAPPANADAATEAPGEGADDDGPGGGGTNAATPPVKSGAGSEAAEAASAIPPVDASAATSPVDAAAAPASARGSSFESSFSQIRQAIQESELGQRAPGVLQDVVQTIFKDDPNFRLLTPGGIVEVPPDQFFLQPRQIQEELQRVLIDPTTGETMGGQQGREVSPQGSEAAKPPDAPGTTPPVTAEPEEDAGASTGVEDANTLTNNAQAASTPATSAPALSNTQAPGAQPSSPQPAGSANAYSTSGSAGGTAATSPSVVPIIDMGKQAKHMPAGYLKGRIPEPGRSILTVDPAELVKYAGKGQPMNAYARGTPGFKERVDFGSVIGDFVEPGHPPLPTTKFAIAYAKNNLVHIYPLRP